MKTKNIFLTLAAILISTIGYSQLVSGASAHNFLTGGSGTGKTFSTEICNVCHVPHNADTPNILPLWNHNSSQAASFQMYTSSTMTADYTGSTGASATMVGGTSKLCLGCHDGATNMDSFGKTAGAYNVGTVANVMAGTDAGMFGTDLRNDHPISIAYNGASAKLNVTTDGVASGGTIATDLLLGGTTVECASCHSLHSPVAATKLLRITTAASTLCLECHIK